MPAPEVAVAYVSIVPSLQGFQQTLRNQIVGPSADAGTNAGESMSGKLATALKAGAVVAGAVLVKGITDALAQSSITSTLQAQLGATSKDAQRYGKVTGKLFSKGVVTDFQQGADAIKAVMQSGIAPAGATNAQLESIATKAADVANIFGQDLGGVTNAVSQMMKTGLAKNSGQAFDIITKGLQSGVDKGGDFLDTINEYGVQFQKAGLDGATSVGLINQAIKAGARDSDIAADAIKEFSIRAVDGSKLSKEGFAALGLSATDMAAKFGKGGASATGALDTTLDRLRAMKDPVAQAAAATALFGTQSEDLGKALFAMDPSKATASLGKFAGAADKAGKTVRSGPMHEITTFTRTLQQGLVSVLGTYVIPALTKLISVAGSVAKAVAAGFKWVVDVAPFLAPFAILIGGITLALNAQAIATGLVTAVFSVYRAAMVVGTAITSGFAAAQALLNAVMALNPFVLVGIALAALVAGIVVAYKHSETFRAIVQAAWKGIQVAAQFAWNNILKPIFSAFGALVSWLYKSVIKPIFGFIVGVFKTWWSNAKSIFALMSAGIRAVGSVFKWLYNNAIRPAWNGISALISSVYNKAIRPVIDKFKSVVGSLGAAFRVAVAAIKVAWDKVKGIARAPVEFIVDTVYNGGIVKVWNKVAGAFGAPKLDAVKFDRGGILPGYTPGRDPHMFYSATGGSLALSGGEAIMRPEVTRALGAGTINGLNAAARTGGVSGVRAAMGGPSQAFADGGIFKWIGNALQGAGSAVWNKAKEGASWLKDGIESSARAGMNSLVTPLLKKIPGSSTLYGKAISGIPNKMMDAIFGYSAKSDKKMSEAGIGGKGTADALNWARAQRGKPYLWGGVGPGGYDCSGLMSAIQNLIMGKAPNRRMWATGAFSGSQAPAGWVQGMKAPFMVGITNSGVGHTAGTLNGVNVESSGGVGVRVGGNARGYKDGLFPSWYGFAPSKKFDSGGWLQPGATMAQNKTGKPEPILTASQWATMATLAGRGAGSAGGLQPGDRLILATAGGSFEAYVDQRADDRIESGLTGPASLGRTL